MGISIEAKNLRASKRAILSEVIPLPAPYVIYIEPTNLCNFKCAFCPTGDKELLKRVGRPSGMMDIKLLKKIVDDIKALQTKIKVVSLYKDGEPLLHPEFPEMVRYVKESGITSKICVKTNGSLLNPSLNKRIVDSGLNWLGISVESISSDGYKKISGVSLDYEKFKENIADLFSRKKDLQIYIKIVDNHLTADEKQKFADDFSPICDNFAIENLMGWSYSSVKDFTLGTNPSTSIEGIPFSEREVCPFPFYSLAINFNGSVSICCSDWSHSTVVGNVKKNSIREIWNGEALFNFRKMHLQGNRCKNRACGDCYYLKMLPDNIDHDKEIILKNIETQFLTQRNQ